MIVLAALGFVMFGAGVALPHRLSSPWDTVSALLGPVGLALLAVGVLGGLIPGFFG